MSEEKKPARKIAERDWDDISEIRKGADKKPAKAAPAERDWDDISEIKRPKAAPPRATEAAAAAPAAEEAPKPAQPAKVSISDEPSAVLDDMKVHSVNGAIVRADGVIVHSTMPMTDAAAGMVASAANITAALMKRSNDVPREIEITFGSTILVLIPMGAYIFCGSVKDREQKKVIREYAEKARAVL
jgi:predicted regulator of Ras-like GTPase activity (Roadblock/LC7/MglB family)